MCNGISIAGIIMGVNSIYSGTHGPVVFGSQCSVSNLVQHLFLQTPIVRNAYHSLVL